MHFELCNQRVLNNELLNECNPLKLVQLICYIKDIKAVFIYERSFFHIRFRSQKLLQSPVRAEQNLRHWKWSESLFPKNLWGSIFPSDRARFSDSTVLLISMVVPIFPIEVF